MELNQIAYSQGFNHGYIIARFCPGLLDKMKNGISESTDYLIGFICGSKEYELELSLNMIKEIGDLRDRKNKDRDIEK